MYTIVISCALAGALAFDHASFSVSALTIRARLSPPCNQVSLYLFWGLRVRGSIGEGSSTDIYLTTLIMSFLLWLVGIPGLPANE